MRKKDKAAKLTEWEIYYPSQDKRRESTKRIAEDSKLSSSFVKRKTFYHRSELLVLQLLLAEILELRVDSHLYV